MKRFIFDLDGTLLTGDFKVEKPYFDDIYKDDSYKIFNNIVKFLNDYEKIFCRYDEKELSNYLSYRSGLKISEDVIKGWIDLVGNIPDTLEDGVIETLEYLKKNDYNLAVLTNWFGGSQKKRLKRSGLIKYFDDIYTGDMVLKPHRSSYLIARNQFSINDCVIIGDNLSKDYIVPREIGMNSVLYDKNDVHDEGFVKIKKMHEIIDKY